MAALKAFAVTEDDENTGAIYFAECDIVARRLGANEFASGDIAYVSCRRAPWADAYAGTAVPARVMIANGWHFECTGCGGRIDEDFLEDRGLTVEGVIGTQSGKVFCCSRCARKHMSLQRRRTAEERRAIEAFKAIVRRRFPDADFCDEPDGGLFRGRHHAYVVPTPGGWHWQQVIVAFRFPGMSVGPAHFVMNDSYSYGPHPAGYTCCAGDRDAFEAYAATTRKRPPAALSTSQIRIWKTRHERVVEEPW